MIGLNKIPGAGRSAATAMRHIASAFALLGLLAGCAATREPIAPAATMAAPASLEWSKAQRIDLVLESFDFRPEHLTLARGQPYLLHLENHAASGHNFDAPDFFRSLALKPDAAADVAKAGGGVVEVPSNGAADIYFVPEKAGHYEFHCSHLLHESFGMAGDITVN